ncbi:unnamed protein product, partial [Ectocarpus sp. 8 AP-2014]
QQERGRAGEELGGGGGGGGGGGPEEQGETAAAAAAARAGGGAEQQRRPTSGTFSGISGGGGGSDDPLEAAWSEGVLETLRRLAFEAPSSSEVDASDLIRRILAARRFKYPAGYASGLKHLDFSHLAAELDVSSAELRSLFGSVVMNMEGASPGASSSWSSPVPSAAMKSPVPATLPPLGADDDGGGEGGAEAKGAPLSPLRSPLLRSPPPRWRPPPLIMSPGARTPRPVSAVSASALSVLSGMAAHFPATMTPLPPPPEAAGPEPEATVAAPGVVPAPPPPPPPPAGESLPPQLPVPRNASGTWWAGKNRGRRPGPPSFPETTSASASASASAAAATDGVRAMAGRKETPVLVVVGGSGDNDQRGSSG